MQPRLAYTVHPGQGPYLAMLHGFLSSSNQWRPNLEALGAVCQPVTIDLWGHGESPSPVSEEAYGPSGYLKALRQVHEELGMAPWFLCGYSIGAGISIRYAHTYANDVIAHVFTNSLSGFADPAQQEQWRTQGPEQAEKIFRHGQKAIERIAVHPRFAKRIPADTYRALVADAKGVCPQVVGKMLLHTTPNVSVRDIAKENPKPALLCYGKHETRFAAGREWADQHMARLETVELDAGHAVNMEDAAGFNNAAVAFLSRHTR